MQTPTFPLVFFSVLGAALLFSAPDENANAANGSQFTYGRGRKVSAAPSFVNQMQCVANTIQKMGYQPRDIGCFGYRPNNRSAHPTGHACDVDQTGRNRTRLNSFSSSQQIAIARSCKAVSGCVWKRSPDCGHFEQISAPYSPAGARIGSHYYGENYARRTTKRRHSS